MIRAIKSIATSVIDRTSAGFSHCATISDDSAIVATRMRLRS